MTYNDDHERQKAALEHLASILFKKFTAQHCMHRMSLLMTVVDVFAALNVIAEVDPKLRKRAIELKAQLEKYKD